MDWYTLEDTEIMERGGIGLVVQELKQGSKHSAGIMKLLEQVRRLAGRRAMHEVIAHL